MNSPSGLLQLQLPRGVGKGWRHALELFVKKHDCESCNLAGMTLQSCLRPPSNTIHDGTVLRQVGVVTLQYQHFPRTILQMAHTCILISEHQYLIVSKQSWLWSCPAVFVMLPENLLTALLIIWVNKAELILLLKYIPQSSSVIYKILGRDTVDALVEVV